VKVESVVADFLLTLAPAIGAGIVYPRPSLMPLRHATNVDVDVQGVDDPLLLDEIARAMPDLFHHLVGTWAVEVRPSDDYGRWLLGLHGAFGCHLWSITSTTLDLPEVITAKLSGFFRAAAAAYEPRSVH
jgi:hypothetical protein